MQTLFLCEYFMQILQLIMVFFRHFRLKKCRINFIFHKMNIVFFIYLNFNNLQDLE